MVSLKTYLIAKVGLAQVEVQFVSFSFTLE